MKPVIGLLALQGGYASHSAVLASIGADVREVRTAADLEGCAGLVLPGGESTVLSKLLLAPPSSGQGLYEAIRDFAAEKPVMGTCAGLIMLAEPCGDDRVASFGLLPVRVERNAYGRQTESFIEMLELDPELHIPEPQAPDMQTSGDTTNARYPAIFIRAPKITAVESGVRVLASSGTTPVLVRYKTLLGLSFHPELSPEDTRIHRYFLKMVKA